MRPAPTRVKSDGGKRPRSTADSRRASYVKNRRWGSFVRANFVSSWESVSCVDSARLVKSPPSPVSGLVASRAPPPALDSSL